MAVPLLARVVDSADACTVAGALTVYVMATPASMVRRPVATAWMFVMDAGAMVVPSLAESSAATDTAKAV